MSLLMVRTERTLSYNDLKKRRCMRQSKSKQRLKVSSAVSTAVQTQKKNPSYINYQIYQSLDLASRENMQSLELNKQPLISSEIREPTQQSQSNRKISLSDRPIQTNEKISRINQIQRKFMLDNFEFDSSQFLKRLMRKQKSQKKILKLSELRDKLKESKQRSRSKSNSQSSMRMSPSRPLQKNSVNSPLKIVKNGLRIKRFVEVDQDSKNNAKPMKKSVSKRKLVQVQAINRVKSVIMISKVKKIQEQNSQNNEESKKYSKIIEKTSQNQSKQGHNQNILHLLEIQNNSQLIEQLQKQSQQKKKKKIFSKFHKMFPEGFLKI